MPKVKMDYSKFSSDRAHVERTQEGYFEGMTGEAVELHLTSGESLEGTLRASTYNRYDVLLENEEGRFLVPKAAIEYVKHCKGEKKK
jgi:sRNA-binding regulator protein Hfq